MKIGTCLRKMRDTRRLTTREIAEKIGVSASTYMDWEHDKSSPSLKSYISIANAFRVCPVELMAYLTAQTPIPMSSEEKISLADMKEMVAYYKNYVDVLKEDKARVETKLNKLQESIRQSVSIDNILSWKKFTAKDRMYVDKTYSLWPWQAYGTIQLSRDENRKYAFINSVIRHVGSPIWRGCRLDIRGRDSDMNCFCYINRWLKEKATRKDHRCPIEVWPSLANETAEN